MGIPPKSTPITKMTTIFLAGGSTIVLVPLVVVVMVVMVVVVVMVVIVVVTTPSTVVQRFGRLYVIIASFTKINYILETFDITLARLVAASFDDLCMIQIH